MSAGADIGQLERVTVRDGLNDLGDGNLGMLIGTVMGPLAWDAVYGREDEATTASETYGVVGVLLHSARNGEASTLKSSGKVAIRISESARVGQLLALDSANPGQLHPDTSGNATPIARALEDVDAGGSVVCRLLNLPIITADASGG